MTAQTATITSRTSRGATLADDLSIDVTATQPPSGMLVGWSMSDNPHPGVCGVARVYDPGDSDVDTAVRTHQVKRLCLSSRDDTTSGATVVSRLRAVLARYPSLMVDYCHENEVDRANHRGGSQADIDAWAREHKSIQDAVHQAWPTGGPVKMAVDMTGYATKLGVSERMLLALRALGALPDVYASSMYPPGRDDSPATKSSFSQFIDPSIDLAAKYGIRLVSCWEIGTPLSPNYDRPSYVASWVVEMRAHCAVRGVTARDFVYWDQQKAGAPNDNRFAADGSTATVQGKTQKALLAA